MKQKMNFITLLCVIASTSSIAQNPANKELSNLKPTAVNRSLIAGTNDSLDLGSALLSWQNLHLTKAIYFSGARGFFASGTNTGAGLNTLNSNTNGVYNTGIGFRAGYNTTTGNYNTSIGGNSLYSNLLGGANTSVGANTLFSNSVGRNNTAIGYNSLRSNTEGDYNTAMGDGSLYSNSIGNYNTANGYLSLYANTTGYDNSAFGKQSLRNNTSGYENVAVGEAALYNSTTAYGNTAIGVAAGDSYSNGIYNTFIGRSADASASFLQQSTALGYGSRITASYQVRVGNSNTTSIGGYENWSNISDGRYKKNIKENVHGLEFINKLRPITYTLDIHAINAKTDVAETPEDAKAISENEKIIHSGFIAQEVEKAAKQFDYDFNGVDKPKNENDFYGLRYAEFVVPLVKAVQELSAQNDELKKRLDKMEEMYLNNQSSKYSSDKAGIATNAYPNPVKNTLYIHSKNKATFFLTDANGARVSTKEINGSGNMDVSKLPAGIYFLKNSLTGDVQKIVVEK